MMEFRDRILRRQSGTGHKNLHFPRVKLEVGVKFFRRYREMMLFREIREIRGGFC